MIVSERDRSEHGRTGTLNQTPSVNLLDENYGFKKTSIENNDAEAFLERANLYEHG